MDAWATTLQFTSTVSQLSGNTLTGGTWNVAANSTLSITTGSNITTNQGTVALSGSGSVFALINTLATNQGSFSILAGRSFTTSGALANSGTVTIDTGSTLTIAGSNSYTQTAGSTTFTGGKLASSSGTGTVSITGGAVHGSGTISAQTVTNAGTFLAGQLPGEISITGNNTQTSAGTLSMQLDGTTAGTQFDQLNVTGTATLSGTLAISLANGYTPNAGGTFEIVSFGSRSGDFTTKTGLNPTSFISLSPL